MPTAQGTGCTLECGSVARAGLEQDVEELWEADVTVENGIAM